MSERLEQRYCIKFCQKLSDSEVDTIRKIQQAFGKDSMSPTTIKEWYNRFENGRLSVESDPRSERPSTSRNDDGIDQMRSLVLQDIWITVRELADDVNISIESVREDFARSMSPDRASTFQPAKDRASCDERHREGDGEPQFFQTFVAKHGNSGYLAGPLITRYGPLRLLVISQAQKASERKTVRVERGDYGKCDDCTSLHPRKSFPEMLRTVEEPLGEVCRV